MNKPTRVLVIIGVIGLVFLSLATALHFISYKPEDSKNNAEIKNIILETK